MESDLPRVVPVKGRFAVFPNKPVLTQYLDPAIRSRSAVGDIRQPWTVLGKECGVSPFEAKALFSLGMVRRYVLAANSLLSDLGHRGFLSAYSLLSSGVELLGRCVHGDKLVRQRPASKSGERLDAGFAFIAIAGQPTGVVVTTNYNQYSAADLKDLRNLAAHGGCITKATRTKGDIELLHELRRAIYGAPYGETDPQGNKGPTPGALDHYFRLLDCGDQSTCTKLADAGISPSATSLQGGAWPFNARIVNETLAHINHNLQHSRAPLSGGHKKVYDHFQLT